MHPSLAACFAANSLVWDGRLVVDAQLRTNDDHIYAAGNSGQILSQVGKKGSPALTAECLVAHSMQALLWFLKWIVLVMLEHMLHSRAPLSGGPGEMLTAAAASKQP